MVAAEASRWPVARAGNDRPMIRNAGPERQGSCADCRERCPVCRRLDPATLAALSRRATQVNLPANASVQTGERRAVHAGMLVRGWLRRVSFGRDGRRRIIGLVQPGELVEPPSSRSGELETATPVRLCRFDRADYDRLRLADPSLRREGLAQGRRELERLRRLSASLATLHPEERLAAFLATSAGAMPWAPLPEGGGVLAVDLPRADIADLLGTTVESISRITRKFHGEGLIRILDPRHFEIRSLAALSRRGCAPTPDAGG